MLEKDPYLMAAMEKTQLHLQKPLVQLHAPRTIFPHLNAYSVASRYPPQNHPEWHDQHYDQCNYRHRFSFLTPPSSR
jgi:hypothetical protein